MQVKFKLIRSFLSFRVCCSGGPTTSTRCSRGLTANSPPSMSRISTSSSAFRKIWITSNENVEKFASTFRQMWLKVKKSAPREMSRNVKRLQTTRRDYCTNSLSLFPDRYQMRISCVLEKSSCAFPKRYFDWNSPLHVKRVSHIKNAKKDEKIQFGVNKFTLTSQRNRPDAQLEPE